MYAVKEGTSKQAWLATVQICPRCGGQHPKSGFKHIHGESICAVCQDEDDVNPTKRINRLANRALAMGDEVSMRHALRSIQTLSNPS